MIMFYKEHKVLLINAKMFLNQFLSQSHMSRLGLRGTKMPLRETKSISNLKMMRFLVEFILNVKSVILHFVQNDGVRGSEKHFRAKNLVDKYNRVF